MSAEWLHETKLRAILILPTILMIGCSSGKLSRENARSALLDARTKSILTKTESEIPLYVDIGQISSSCGEAVTDTMKALQQAGLIRIDALDSRSWRVYLTEQGKDQAGKPFDQQTRIDCNHWTVNFRLAHFKDLKVTGILGDANTSKVDVEETFLLTPTALRLEQTDLLHMVSEIHNHPEFRGISKNVAQYSVQKVAEFAKYDDGWRVIRYEDAN